MKKLVYLFAIVLGVSFASCVTDGNNNSGQDSQAAVENTAEGGDTIDVKDNAQEGDTLKKDAPAEEQKADEAQDAKTEEAK